MVRVCLCCMFDVCHACVHEQSCLFCDPPPGCRDNIKSPLTARNPGEGGVRFTRSGSLVPRCTPVNPFVQFCGEMPDPDTDAEFNTGCWFGVVLPFCEFVPCRGEAPGIENYYRLTLTSQAEHYVRTGDGQGHYSPDLIFSVRGLAEDPNVLFDMIKERAILKPDQTGPRLRTL